MEKITTPRFTLPGYDSLRVRSLGYARGLNVVPSMLFDQLPPGAELPEAILSTMPTEQAKIDELAQAITEVHLTSLDGQPVTNNPALFRQYYAKGFTEGYRFGLFALPRGFMKLSYSLPAERRFDLAFRFAWELFMHEPAPETDLLMSQALEKVNVLYTQYRALN